MSEPYRLKKEVNEDALLILNNPTYEKMGEQIYDAIHDHFSYPSENELEDWISALKSGKGIINPLSPKEVFQKNYYSTVDDIKANPDDEGSKAFKAGMDCAFNCFVKEHPDVADWLKDGDHS